MTFRHTAEEEAKLPARFATCSGTLLFVEGALYFLTAGHVLKSLRELRDREDVVIEGAALADVFGYRPVSDTPIPFDLKNAQLCFVDDEGLALDFGVIPIGPHHARLLAKNRMVALSEDNWVKQHSVKFEGYAMLGFPAELVSERVSDSSTVRIEPTMFPVGGLEPTQDHRRTEYPRFVGQISDGLPLKSLEGMSGGVIFGFRTQPRLAYWIVAIQSSWNPQTRMIYGCSLPVLASLMTHWAKNNIAVLQELDRNAAAICPTIPNAALPTGP